jgi:hypothetical protein
MDFAPPLSQFSNGVGLPSSALIYVFTGPSLHPDEARGELDAVYLPPVSQGDVYRVGRNEPWAIGIIDGYFDRVPAVWHKEILWALAQGIRVYGSASMGALRAAELAAFGMEGIGDIFAQYRDGVIEDDDEVAVAHGPAENGYVAMSEAMVNMRATLAVATADRVITRSTERALVELAKTWFYPERSYPPLLRDAADRGLPAGELAALENWLPAGRVDQKRADARAMLRSMREQRARDPSPGPVSFVLEHSPYSIRAAQEAGELRPTADGDPRALFLPSVLDELRLEPRSTARAFDGALHRHLLLAEADRRGLAASDGSIAEALHRFRAAHDLMNPDDFIAWKLAQSLSDAQFAQLLREEAVVGQVRRVLRREALGALPDYLKINGEFGRYAARALEKQMVLETHGLPSPGTAETSVTDSTLLDWYFARVSTPVPPDIAAYAQGLGLDLKAFLRALYREYCFVQLAP